MLENSHFLKFILLESIFKTNYTLVINQFYMEGEKVEFELSDAIFLLIICLLNDFNLGEAMKHFLDKHSLRRYTIMELFLRDQQTWTITEIATRLDLDTRTVAKDLSALQAEFFAWPDIIFISHKNGVSFSLSYAAHFNPNKILFHFLETSIPFLFITELLAKPSINPLNFIDNHFISKSTFYRHLKTIKEILATFELSLSSPPFTLIGNEEQIRFFYYFFFNDFDEEHFWQYFPINQESLITLLNSVENIMHFQTLEYNRQSLIKLLAIHKYRMLGKHYAPPHQSSTMYPLCDEVGIYSFSIQTLTEFLRQSKLPEAICYNESISILASVISLAFFEQTESIADSVIKYNYRSKSVGIQLVDKTLELCCQYFDLPQEEITKFIKASLLSVYFFVVNYTVNISYFETMEQYKDFMDEYQTEINQCTKAVFQLAKKILPKENYQHIIASETYITYSLTKILLPIIKHRKIRRAIRVYAACTKGYHQTRYLQTYLINHFAFNLEFASHPIDADIIITDTEFTSHQTNENAVIINYHYPFLSEVDKHRLQAVLTDLERKL